ncbi:OmpA family protein [Thermophagus xiamenensis]|jgi:chemotaxis protein MotB|uniref:Chemotaxis protein MotB n=1 Tax=Thermophagus xiamenensis TaxID=385682 RepID=A0A1I2EJ27_9BACT|nr:OmpA family protein [Thermophagus xiamenensis]SFE92982.1 chemotaxis protein MotB [Thermophagus xiamenensis]
MKLNQKLFAGAGLLFILIGCVPLNQYRELEEANRQLDDKVESLSSENEILLGRTNELKELADRLKEQIAELSADTLQKGREVRSCRNDLKKLREEYDDLLSQLRSRTGAGDTEELLAYLQKLQEELQAREDALIAAERDLKLRKAELEDAMARLKAAQDDLAAKNQRLLELEQALAQKDSASRALRQAIADALTGFDQSQLKVHMKNGKVYVSMEEKLLFGSGSYQVSAEGASAVRQVAKVLAENKDINIMVEGHTDPVPYRSGVLLDNWDLSVKRATSVVRILLENSGIDPSRIIAAGRGPYVPLVSNDTPEGKRKNRRTEIILTPRLDKILNILESN